MRHFWTSIVDIIIPSNSYIYLYGNMDMAEKLRWMDEEYLSKFDSLQLILRSKLQKPLHSLYLFRRIILLWRVSP